MARHRVEVRARGFQERGRLTVRRRPCAGREVLVDRGAHDRMAKLERTIDTKDVARDEEVER